MKNELGYYILDIPEQTKLKCWWQCYDCDYEFESIYACVNSGNWCPDCAGKRKKNILDYQNLPTEKDIKITYIGIKNNDENYILDIPKTIHEKCWWKCNICNNEFFSTYKAIKRGGNRCGNCGLNIKILTGNNEYLSLISYQNIAITNNGQYIGILNNDEYILNVPQFRTEESYWKCENCDIIFLRSYSDINNGCFHPLCSKTSKKFLEHYHKLLIDNNLNGKYLGIKDDNGDFILDIPENSRLDLGWWKCDKNHIFNRSYEYINQNTFCLECNHILFGSKIERECKYYLDNNNIKYIQQFRFENLQMRKFDFEFIHNNRKYIIETDGEQHFKQNMWHTSQDDFLNKQDIDKLKTLTAIYNNYNIIKNKGQVHYHIAIFYLVTRECNIHNLYYK